VGVRYNHTSKAYDWNELIKNKVVQDSLPGLPILVTAESDSASFHVFDRTVKGKILLFTKFGDWQIKDNTGSTWNINGECVDGLLKGQKLQSIQAYQEFWHSWKTFHPETKQYNR
jgi:hypothetical protein